MTTVRTDSNPDQLDSDTDGLGDACDACPNDINNDADSDDVCGDLDNCPTDSNPDQLDSDTDGLGDACDACPNDINNDADSDDVCDDIDNCEGTANTDQADNDQDGRGDLCDPDDDNDGVNDTEDNCPLVSNANQADSDNNQIGDFCDGEREFAEISSRADVGTGDNVAIGGFIVRGPQIPDRAPRGFPIPNKTVLIRGLGPSLDMTGDLDDPVIKLYDSNGMLLAENDDWQDAANADEITATGLAPDEQNEAAILVELVANANYTAVLSGKNDTTGIGLVEIYDLEIHNGSTLANISTRAHVQTGDEVLIGGIIVRGNNQAEVVVRAIGPSLAAHGVPDPLLDPVLELYNANGQLIDSNDDWANSPDAATITAYGLAPTDPKESALVFFPGHGRLNTAIVKGASNTTGVGLVEAYNARAKHHEVGLAGGGSDLSRPPLPSCGRPSLFATLVGCRRRPI